MVHRSGYFKQYFHEKRLRMITALGGCCQGCGNPNEPELCFVHVGPYKLQKWNKGRQQRYENIAKHPQDYVLLCRTCRRLAYQMGKWRPEFELE